MLFIDSVCVLRKNVTRVRFPYNPVNNEQANQLNEPLLHTLA